MGDNVGDIVNFNSKKRNISRKRKRIKYSNNSNTPIYLYILGILIVVFIIANRLQELINTPVTYLIIGINGIIFLLIYTNRLNVNYLGSSYYQTITDNEIYRVVTAAFTHREPWHFLMNMYSLYNIGTVLEAFMNPYRFLVMYVVIMLIGGYVSAKCHKNHSPNALCIGASGVICGLLGVYMVIIFRIMGLSGLRGLLPTLICLVLMTAAKNIDSIGHFVGLGVGIVYGILILLI